ncbi:hypothetical protein LUZ60_008436 [Juncus effusus]|nr:hypothetical protein LUZ60_008436 [Juncus effusus]
MASSDERSGPTPMAGSDPKLPGQPTTVASKMLDKGAAMLQSLKPVKQMKQHVCTFALYGHDLTRQIETHHFIARLNQDVLQCAVYDSDEPKARLIGVEYIVSEKVFESLPLEEQKLWHSHAYEIKSGLWANPRVPEMLQKPELDSMAHTYGKFWCTWQADRGDRLPLGAPALMFSPQSVHPDLVHKRDEKYKISTEELRMARGDVEEPEKIHPNADYWMKHSKGFAVDVEPAVMKRCAPFP